jgi:hypothetical protein
MALIPALFPSRAGVATEGNNGNKNPGNHGVFPRFPTFLGYTRDGNEPSARPSRRTPRRNPQPVRQTFARLWNTTSMGAPL